jgi:hypothetical protein
MPQRAEAPHPSDFESNPNKYNVCVLAMSVAGSIDLLPNIPNGSHFSAVLFVFYF